MPALPITSCLQDRFQEPRRNTLGNPFIRLQHGLSPRLNRLAVRTEIVGTIGTRCQVLVEFGASAGVEPAGHVIVQEFSKLSTRHISRPPMIATRSQPTNPSFGE